MEIWEIVFIGVGLSMDAFAVGMTDGMAEPRMRILKIFLIAGAFGLFQFLMPVLGYYLGSVFTALVAKIAPWLSFAILAFLGGKMIFDFIMEHRKKGEEVPAHPTGAVKLLVQAVATSIDALAVGVTLLAAETSQGLPFHVTLCALVIGAITFALSIAAVFIGKKAGDKFSDKAQLLGGVILVAIGLKILIEGLIA